MNFFKTRPIPPSSPSTVFYLTSGKWGKQNLAKQPTTGLNLSHRFTTSWQEGPKVPLSYLLFQHVHRRVPPIRPLCWFSRVFPGVQCVQLGRSNLRCPTKVILRLSSRQCQKRVNQVTPKKVTKVFSKAFSVPLPVIVCISVHLHLCTWFVENTAGRVGNLTRWVLRDEAELVRPIEEL